MSTDQMRQQFLAGPALTLDNQAAAEMISTQDLSQREKLELKKSQEPPVEIASRFASLADQQEAVKNYQLAEEYNNCASQYFLEALAVLKQKKDCDPDALQTLQILSETHRRKAKLMKKRIDWGVGSVRNKYEKMVKNQRDIKRAMNQSEEKRLADPKA